jgi:DNA (cytosine-5)-methyltransferase 1
MGRIDYETETLIAHSLRADGFDASEDGTGRGTPIVPIAIQERAVSENPDNGPQGKGWQEGIGYTLEGRSNVQAVAFDARQSDVLQYGDMSGPLDTDGHTIAVGFQNNASFCGDYGDDLSPTMRAQKSGGGGMPAVAASMQVRRLTPRECERLQGFPDDYTLIPYRGKLAADGPRYKALGNSFAVPVVRWIGRRIQMVEDL